MNIEEVYDEYVGKVYKFFYIQCFDRSLAEDLTSKTFVAYLETVENRTINNPKTYLYGTMRNIWMQYLRDKYSEKTALLSNPELMENYVEYVTGSFSDEPLQDRAERYLKLLPPMQQQTVRLKVINQISTKEIAVQLGMDVNSVKANYKRGIKRLREVLKEVPYDELLEQKGAQR